MHDINEHWFNELIADDVILYGPDGLPLASEARQELRANVALKRAAHKWLAGVLREIPEPDLPKNEQELLAKVIEHARCRQGKSVIFDVADGKLTLPLRTEVRNVELRASIPVYRLVAAAWAAWSVMRMIRQPRIGELKKGPRGLDFCWFPSGQFRMINSYHTPTQVQRGFWISRTLVHVSVYETFASENRQAMPPATSQNPDWEDKGKPILGVSFEKAEAFCTWAGARLPSESEWEWALFGGIASYPEWSKWKADLPLKLSSYREWVGSVLPQTWQHLSGSERPVKRRVDSSTSHVACGWINMVLIANLTNRIAVPNGCVAEDIGFRCVLDGS